jgi:hypothetical protein
MRLESHQLIQLLINLDQDRSIRKTPLTIHEMYKAIPVTQAINSHTSPGRHVVPSNLIVAYSKAHP